MSWQDYPDPAWIGGDAFSRDGATIDTAPPPDLESALVADELRKLRVRERARALHVQAQRGPAEPFDADTLAGLLRRPPEPLARIDGLMPWSAGVLLVAQRKAGKTTLGLNLSRSLLTGEDFLGRCGVRRVDGTVGMLNFEVSGAQLARWAAEAAVPDDRLFIVNLRGRRNPLADPGDRARLANLLREHDVETLIVDPFGRAYAGASQNDAGEVGAWLAGLDRFARAEVGALDLILTAHAGWNGERTRGTSALEDWADVIWTLTRGASNGDDPDGRYLRALGRDVDMEEDRLDFDPDGRRLTLSGAGSRRQVTGSRKVDELTDWVVQAIEANPGGLGVQELRAALRALPDAPTLRRGDVAQAAEKARDAGRILIVGGGPGQRKLHYPNPSQPVPTRPGDDPVTRPTRPIGDGYGLGTGEPTQQPEPGDGSAGRACCDCGSPVGPGIVRCRPCMNGSVDGE